MPVKAGELESDDVFTVADLQLRQVVADAVKDFIKRIHLGDRRNVKASRSKCRRNDLNRLAYANRIIGEKVDVLRDAVDDAVSYQGLATCEREPLLLRNRQRERGNAPLERRRRVLGQAATCRRSDACRSSQAARTPRGRYRCSQSRTNVSPSSHAHNSRSVRASRKTVSYIHARTAGLSRFTRRSGCQNNRCGNSTTPATGPRSRERSATTTTGRPGRLVPAAVFRSSTPPIMPPTDSEGHHQTARSPTAAWAP